MRNRVSTFSSTPDPTFGAKPAPRRPVHGYPESPPPPSAEDLQADLRLVIEEDEANGSYVYKTVNRRTGKVVLQMPRDELLQLREDEDYLAGDVIRTKA